MISPISYGSPALMEKRGSEGKLWKVALVALMILNPAAAASNYCPVAYQPMQQLCPAGAFSPPGWDRIKSCALLMSSGWDANVAHCRKVTRALQPYNEWRVAIEESDVKRVQSLCAYGLDLEYAFPEAMDKAISSDDPALYPIFEAILQAGADPDEIFTTRTVKPYRGTALAHLYRNRKQENLIRLFLKFQANPRVLDSNGARLNICGLNLYTNRPFPGIYRKRPNLQQLRKELSSPLCDPSLAALDELERELEDGLDEIKRREPDCYDNLDNYFAQMFVEEDLKAVQTLKENL